VPAKLNRIIAERSSVHTQSVGAFQPGFRNIKVNEKKERESPSPKNHPTVVLVTAEAAPINTMAGVNFVILTYLQNYHWLGKSPH
jgi:hypothetical protein